MSTRFLTLLQKLEVPDPLDPGKTILDNTVILWTSEVNGSDSHNRRLDPRGGLRRPGRIAARGQGHELSEAKPGRPVRDDRHGDGRAHETFGSNGSTGVITEMLA